MVQIKGFLLNLEQKLDCWPKQVACMLIYQTQEKAINLRASEKIKSLCQVAKHTCQGYNITYKSTLAHRDLLNIFILMTSNLLK